MKVVLIKDVEKLGNKGDIKEVSAGYARNMLLPQKLVVLATPKAIERAEKVKKLREKEDQEKNKRLDEQSAKLKDITIKIKKKANDEGKLFAAITATDVKKELAKQEIEVSEDVIKFVDPIKNMGHYEVDVMKGKIKLIVEKE